MTELLIPEEGADLHQWFKTHSGLELDGSISSLREQQREALEWIQSRPEPYLFVNAPTGSGKTLLAMTYGVMRQKQVTYAVHTIMLQNQVAKTFPNLPVMTGRRNHECWVGEQIYGVPDEYTADKGICVVDAQACQHSPKGRGGDGYASPDDEEERGLCPYYSQLNAALWSRHRVANYAMLLSYPPLQERTRTLLADEGHNVEESVVSQASLSLNRRNLSRFGLRLPRAGADMAVWREWAKVEALPRLPKVPTDGRRPDFGLKILLDVLGNLSRLGDDETGQWLVEEEERGVSFTPIWGRDFVMSRLFDHAAPPPNADAYEAAEYRQQGIDKVLLVSATLMGAEYIASTLGFPDGSWAYLDLPSTFPVANRPINFSPIAAMSYANREEARPKMQEAIDKLIDYYVLNNQPSGIIHAVSNEYRDNILQNSRWRGIIRTSADEHEAAVKRGEASVLVAANLTEGWDGYDDLCRFIIMPKVPFPSLGDKRTNIRKNEDARSYDHRTLVSVVQGAGRGVRHREDTCDTWILDGSWQQLYARTKDWLPDSFTSAYHHRVAFI